MRSLLIALVSIAALASLALCGSYGWDQGGGVLKDQVTQAFMFAVLNAFSLLLHVGAVKAWVMGWRKTGFAAGFVGMLALVMTIFTSIGGLASRADKVVADRQDVLNSKADIKGQIDQLVTERHGLKFSRASQATVDAARMLADAASRAREQECGKLGENCRKRQDAEGVALGALATAQANKAATDRAAEIDADLKRLRTPGITTGSVGAADPLRALLTKILGAWGTFLSDWQKALVAVVYDLCLVVGFILIEVFSTTKPKREEPEAPDMRKKPENVDISPEPAPVATISEPVADVVRLPVRPRPRLAAATKQPVGAVLDFIAEGLDITDGPETEMADCFVGYLAWCSGQARRALDVTAFVAQLESHCREFGIRIREDGDRHYLRNVRLLKLGKAENAP